MRRWAAGIAALLTALTPSVAMAKYRGTDVWGNLAPGDQTAGLADKYPLSFYGLDYHVDGPSVGLGGISTGDVPAMIAQFLASLLFQFSTWLINIVLDIFDWAFSVDLVNGPHGALLPIGKATQSLYSTTLSPFLAAAIVLAGMWAIHKGLVQRRFSDVASGIALSVVLVVVAMVLILKPAQTIGTASGMTNELSSALLAGATTGSPGDGTQAQVKAKDHLFKTFVYQPWVVMEFGGLKHCVSGERDKDGFPMPVAPNDPARRVCRDHLEAHGGWGGYAPRFLQSAPGSDERDQMYEAIKTGEQNPTWPVWNVDKADAPAVDIQQAGGSFQRLALATVIFIGVLGAVLLLGMLAFAALLAQVIALALLAFAPAALLCALFPGAGHRIFRSWGGKLLTAVFIKAVLSLMIAILVAVSLAMSAAVGDVSYLFAFGLPAAFFWMVFLKRKDIGGLMLKQRDTTRLERTTREVISTPIAAAAGAGWAGGVAAARRMRSSDEDTPAEQQEHVGKPGQQQAPGTPAQPQVAPPVPVVGSGQVSGRDTAVQPTTQRDVEREPAQQPEPDKAGRDELAPALAAARAQEEAEREDQARSQPTIAEALYQARQGQPVQNDHRPGVTVRGDGVPPAAAGREPSVQGRPDPLPAQQRPKRPDEKLERPVPGE